MRYQLAVRIAKVSTMATTIKQAVYPLLLTCSILGLGVHNPLKPYLSILYSLTVWTVYSYLFYYVITVFKVEKWFLSPISLVSYDIAAFTSVVIIILSIYQDKKFRAFMKRLQVVDNTLEELGTPKIYYKLHVYSKRITIAWLMCCHSGNMCDMIWWFRTTKDWRSISISYITNHYYNVNMFMDLLLVTFLWYIGTRFDKVNEHMRYLLVTENHGLRCTWKKVLPITRLSMRADNYKRVLWTLMHLHLELCRITRQLNTLFGFQITLMMLTHLIYITKILTYAFIHVKTQGRFISSPLNLIMLLFWIPLHVIKLFGLNYICENISAKANEAKKIIHQLLDSLRYNDVHDELHQFTLQLIHRPLKFTGLGLFYLGNHFLQKFFTRVSTLVMILVQMSSEN